MFVSKSFPIYFMTFNLHYKFVILQIVRLDFCLILLKDEIQYLDSKVWETFQKSIIFFTIDCWVDVICQTLEGWVRMCKNVLYTLIPLFNFFSEGRRGSQKVFAFLIIPKAFWWPPFRPASVQCSEQILNFSNKERVYTWTHLFTFSNLSFVRHFAI